MALSQGRRIAEASDPVAHIAKMLRLGGSPCFGIAMLWAYFDETVVNNQTMIFGGCVASAYQWAAFTPKWRRALHKEGVSEFHAAKFHTGNSDFNWRMPNGQRDDKRIARFDKKLASIITENVQGAFSFMAPVIPTKGQKPEQAAYRLAVNDAFRSMLRRLFWGDFKVQYFVVARRSGVSPISVLHQFEEFKFSDHLAGCGVFPPSEFLPLQAADYVLHAINRKEQGHQNNTSLDHLRSGFSKSGGLFLTKGGPSDYATSEWKSWRGRPS